MCTLIVLAFSFGGEGLCVFATMLLTEVGSIMNKKLILIAFVIVLGYLAFHLTGIAAVVCGIIDVLFIIGFAKGLLGL